MKAEKYYSEEIKELGKNSWIDENRMIAENISYIYDAMEAIEKTWQTENVSNETYIKIMEMLATEMKDFTKEYYKNKEAE